LPRENDKKREKPQSVLPVAQLTLKPDDLRTRIITATPTCPSGKCYKFTLILQETEHTMKDINKHACMYCCRSMKYKTRQSDQSLPSAENYISPSAATVSIPNVDSYLKSLQTESDGLILKVPSLILG
jgi:hypothetical protein